jgi:hypothetical protein
MSKTGGFALAPQRFACHRPSSEQSNRSSMQERPGPTPQSSFVPSDEATVQEWQRHKNPDNSVDQILKLAKKFGLPDNIPLLPRLRALAKANVLAFNRKF